MDATLKTQAETLASEMATQATTIDDLNGLLRAMMKSALEAMLNTEMDVHLGRKPLALPTEAPPAAPKNRRNGHSRKTVAGDLGELTLLRRRSSSAAVPGGLMTEDTRRQSGQHDQAAADTSWFL